MAREKGRAAERAPAPIPVLIGGGLMILLLFALLVEQDVSRNRIESQEEIAQRTEQRSGPVLEASAGLIEDVRGLSPDVRRAARDLETSLEDLPGAIDSVQDVAVRLPYVINAGAEVLDAIQVSGIVAHTVDLLAEIDRAGLVPRAVDATRKARSLVGLQRKLLRIQKRSYREIQVSRKLQEQSLQVQTESLRVQTESLKHIRSIDLKTGGTITP